jgi:hypothetical protein
MSISSAILADNPLLYWPLDDATGPAASDASGNGNPGVYNGQFFTHQRGPESGTFAALFNGVGEVASLNPSPQRVEPWTIEVWVAQVNLYQLGGALAYNGNGAANGSGLVWIAGNINNNKLSLTRGGIANFDTGFNVQDGLWHQYVATRSAVPQIQVFVDGAVVAPLQAGGGINAIPATEKYHAGPGVIAEREYVAHVALWASVLTAAQIAAHFTGRGTAQEPAGTPQQLGTDLSTLLSYVSRLYQNSP